MLCCLSTLSIWRSKHPLDWIVYAMSIWRSKHVMHSMLHKTRISNAFNAMYVNTVDTKHIYTFLPITFLIFNQFSIHKNFWKAETVGFSTIPSNTIYVETVDTKHKYLMHFYPITFLRNHPNSFLCVCQHCQQTT